MKLHLLLEKFRMIGKLNIDGNRRTIQLDANLLDISQFCLNLLLRVSLYMSSKTIKRYLPPVSRHNYLFTLSAKRNNDNSIHFTQDILL